jgi:hypothetical protein
MKFQGAENAEDAGTGEREKKMPTKKQVLELL